MSGVVNVILGDFVRMDLYKNASLFSFLFLSILILFYYAIPYSYEVSMSNIFTTFFFFVTSLNLCTINLQPLI